MGVIYFVNLVNLVMGSDVIIEVVEDELILEVVENQGLDLFYFCWVVFCVVCVGCLLEGMVEYMDKGFDFFKLEELVVGCVLFCVVYVIFDCKIFIY